jgi:hypothetical protein
MNLDTITLVSMPIESLLTCGCCHLRIPDNILREYENGPAAEWLKSTKENYEILTSNSDAFSLVLETQDWLALELGPLGRKYAAEAGVISRLGDEANNWHYDTDKASWSDLNSVTDADRTHPEREFFKVVIAFPPSTQPPTVIIPWGSPLKGVPVQAPCGYASAFLGAITGHRSDIRPGWRGRYVQLFTPI